MKTLLLGTGLLALSAWPAQAGDKIPACEIVVRKAVMETDIRQTGAMVVTFLPADDFIVSVLDSGDGHLTEIDGNKILALLCTRNHLIPTELDLQLLKTGVPLSLSQNFDSPESGLMSVSKQNGVFVYDYAGPELSKTDKDVMELLLERLNTGDG